MQEYYEECYEELEDRKQCIEAMRFEVDQNGLYKLRHLLIP